MTFPSDMTVNVDFQIPDALYSLQFLPTNMKLDFVNVSFTEKPRKPAKFVRISTLIKFCADLVVNIKKTRGRGEGGWFEPQNAKHCSIVQYYCKRVSLF